MKRQNVILLAAPLSGARPLAKSLVEQGWSTGGICEPDFRDATLSSYESEMLVSANSVVLNGTKILNEWNNEDRLNWASLFDMSALNEVPVEWSDQVREVLMTQGPCVLKDPQMARTFAKWRGLVGTTPVLVLFRFPVDFIASVMHGIDMGWWPEIPKDPDYLCKLWMDYYDHILNMDDGSFLYRDSTEQLCKPNGMTMINQVLGCSLLPLESSRVTHWVRRDTAMIPKETWKLYDKLFFKTMLRVIPAPHHERRTTRTVTAK